MIVGFMNLIPPNSAKKNHHQISHTPNDLLSEKKTNGNFQVSLFFFFYKLS